MNNNQYIQSVAWVFHQTEATQRHMLKRVRLPNGVPFRLLGQPVTGPQCVTLTLQIRSEDLRTVLGLGDQLAMAAQSQFARVYRDLGFVRVEFTLPKTQWRNVEISRLPHHATSATIGQQALGPPARVSWEKPHKALFGSTQSGKTVCLSDFIISLSKTHQPDDCRMLILNCKNSQKLKPFARLPHLAAQMANDYETAFNLLRYALAEMEKRRQDHARCRQRLVIFLDEMSRLVEEKPEAGPVLAALSQEAGEMQINLVAASQAANPKVFGERGSLAKANFPSRIVFLLPNEQAYLATGLAGQHTEKLGGKGDGLAVNGGRVTRFRAALPTEADYANLDRSEDEPDPPDLGSLAGESAWQISPHRLAYALVVNNSATAIRKEFKCGTGRAMQVRDYAKELADSAGYWRNWKAEQKARAA